MYCSLLVNVSKGMNELMLTNRTLLSNNKMSYWPQIFKWVVYLNIRNKQTLHCVLKSCGCLFAVIEGDFGDRYFGTDGSSSWSDEEQQEPHSCSSEVWPVVQAIQATVNREDQHLL